MEAQPAAYKALVSPLPAWVGSLEPLFFGNMLLALECFVHRARGLESKDGNPLNEVRMLSNSILQSGGVLAADSTISLSLLARLSFPLWAESCGL